MDIYLTDLGLFIDLTSPNGQIVSEIPKLISVALAVQRFEWRLPRGRHPINVLLKVCLLNPTTLLSQN